MKKSRLVVFSDGPVGLAAVRIALNDFIDHLVGVVVVDAASEIAEVVRAHAPHVKVMAWHPGARDDLLCDLRSLQADIVFLAWWPFLLRDELDCGQRFSLNMHPSLLPFGRGKDPNFWALALEEPFGVTIHHVTLATDAGDIAFQRRLSIDWVDTAETLYERARVEILRLFRESLPLILSLQIPSVPQPEGGSHHFRRDLEPASRFSLDAPTTARSLLNLVRARTFPPHPGCSFEEDGRKFEVRIEIKEVHPEGERDLSK